MKVSDAIKLLQSMPQDANLVASTDGSSPNGPGSFRFDAATLPMIAGFSADELRKEEYEFLLFEKEKIVVLCLTVNPLGEPMR